jgi:hypothetical protein
MVARNRKQIYIRLTDPTLRLHSPDPAAAQSPIDRLPMAANQIQQRWCVKIRGTSIGCLSLQSHSAHFRIPRAAAESTPFTGTLHYYDKTPRMYIM